MILPFSQHQAPVTRGFLFVDLGQSHNPDVAGSNPAPATMKTRLLTVFLFVDLGRAYNLNG